MKQILKASVNDKSSVQTRLSKFLLAYRSAEHSLAKQSPAQLFLKRSLRTRLDLGGPRHDETVRDKLNDVKEKSAEKETSQRVSE